MTKFKNVFLNEEFEKKIINLKLNISKKLNDNNFQLDNLEINELFGYNNFEGFTKIYPSHKCPEEIKTIIIDLIKVEFNEINN